MPIPSLARTFSLLVIGLGIVLCGRDLTVSPQRTQPHAASIAQPEPSPPSRLPASSSRIQTASHHPDASSWLGALGQGHPLQLQPEDPSFFPTTLVFQPADYLSPGFTLSQGAQLAFPPSQTRLFSGRALFPGRPSPPADASLAVTGGRFCAFWQDPDGSGVRLEGTLGDPAVTLFRLDASPLRCDLLDLDGDSDRLVARQSRLSPPAAVTATPGKLVLARGGLDPASGEPTRFADPISWSRAYALSLKDMNILLVLDKSATGGGDDGALRTVASRWLATFAHVAAIYENQLGIRLQLQEMILIPDDSSFDDVPHDNVLPDFHRWISRNRPRSVHLWHSAFKVGDGLSPSELGLAYVASLGRPDSVGVIATDTGWSTLAHELGHSLGASHTRGGLMNAQANAGGQGDFFTEALNVPGTTAASQIHKHSAVLLAGESDLRHPQEIPWAENDFRMLPPGSTLHFDPLENDASSVAFGQPNPVLSIDSVSTLHPPEAGSLSHDGRYLTLVPHPDFRGPVSFSYALRGSRGNQGRGWLHKGDVTVLFDDRYPDPDHLVLAPGETRSLFVGDSVHPLTQPHQTLVHDLPGQPGYLFLRAGAQATGTDSFTVGPRRIALSYQPRSASVRDDHYWHHPDLGPLRLSPLDNDQPSSAGGLRGAPQLTLGPEGPALTHTFAPAFHLTHLDNLSPDQGSLTTGGHSDEYLFWPEQDAPGPASLRYTARDPQGDLLQGNITIHMAGDSDVLVASDAAARYFIPPTPASSATWMLRSFDDRSWPLGALPIGYDDGRGYETWITTKVGRQMVNVNTTLYLRIPFTGSQIDDITRLLLRLRVDDGFIAYLNGHEVARDNAPSEISWNARAVEGREADAPVTYDLSEARSLLREGTNLLAIQGLNAQIDSSDFLIMPELVAFRLPLLARIRHPASVTLRTEPGTGILFHQETPPPAEAPITPPVSVHWQITQADAPVISTRHPDGSFAVRFMEPGTYRIQLLARDASGASTVDHRVVRVGPGRSYDAVVAAIEAGPDLTLTDPHTRLTVTSEPTVPGQLGATSWTQIEGPASAHFSTPNDLQTDVAFPSPGRYHLRVQTAYPTLTVFDDVQVDVQTTIRTLVGAGVTSRYAFLTEASLAPGDWTLPALDHSAWKIGGQGLGYDLTGAFNPYIDTNLQQAMHFRHTSLFARYRFNLENPLTVFRLLLTLRWDDGCVVYLNGREVARRNAPFAGLRPAASATRPVDEVLLQEPLLIDLTSFKGHLLSGANVLAIHGLNQSITSSDFLIQPSLVAHLGEDFNPPNDPGTLIAAALGDHGHLRLQVDRSAFTVSYLRKKEFLASGGTIEIQTSSDLREWRPWPATAETATDVDDFLEEVQLSGPLELGRAFIRLHIHR